MTDSFFIVFNKIAGIWKNYCSEYFNILIIFIFKVITRMFEYAILLYKHIKQQSILLYKYLKQQIINFYNHVIIDTAPEIAVLAEKNALLDNIRSVRNQREKAPSLWLLKLDFLAFFSILNRLFSILLFIIILFYFSFFFIYNINLITTKYVFYLCAIFCLTFIVHIGFNSVKIALIFSNFKKLISNNLLNIQKFYILIYFFLLSFCIFYILMYVFTFFKIESPIFLGKTLFVNSMCETLFIDFNLITASEISFIDIQHIIFIFIFILFIKYKILLCFMLNSRALLVIVIKFSCFCTSLGIILSIYFNNSIHALYWWYPEIINLKSVDCYNKQKSTFMLNPFAAEKRRVIQKLIDSVKEEVYPLYFLNDLHRGSGVPNKTNSLHKRQLYLIEDVYYFVALKRYRDLVYLIQKRISK